MRSFPSDDLPDVIGDAERALRHSGIPHRFETRKWKKGMPLDDHAVPETGRTRRYFKMTPSAIRILKAIRQRLFGLWEGLETRLDDV